MQGPYLSAYLDFGIRKHGRDTPDPGMPLAVIYPKDPQQHSGA